MPLRYSEISEVIYIWSPLDNGNTLRFCSIFSEAVRMSKRVKECIDTRGFREVSTL